MNKIAGLGDDIILIHLSPMINMPSLQSEGVHPRYSLKADGKVWFVTWQAVLWAYVHTSQRHAIATNLIVACLYETSTEHIYADGFRHHGRNRFWNTNPICPSAYLTLEEVLEQLP